MGTDDGASSHVTGAQVVDAKLLSPLLPTEDMRRLRVVRIWRGRNWTTLVIPSVPLPPLGTLRRRGVGMIRQAATQEATPVPSKLRAIRTGGRTGRIGRSTVRKAGGLWMIPRYATTLETGLLGGGGAVGRQQDLSVRRDKVYPCEGPRENVPPDQYQLDEGQLFP